MHWTTKPGFLTPRPESAHTLRCGALRILDRAWKTCMTKPLMLKRQGSLYKASSRIHKSFTFIVTQNVRHGFFNAVHHRPTPRTVVPSVYSSASTTLNTSPSVKNHDDEIAIPTLILAGRRFRGTQTREIRSQPHDPQDPEPYNPKPQKPYIQSLKL